MGQECYLLAAEKLSAFFLGLSRAYGECLSITPSTPGQKTECRYRVVYGVVGNKVWEEHIEGTRSIGIIPINDSNQCHFGAIDIDVYTEEATKDLIDKVRHYNLPLIPCRSKSGGIHLYVFLSGPIKASALREKLGYMASLMGYGTSEVFPKQNAVAAAKGEVANFINMPYYNGDKTSRFAFDHEGNKLSLDQFIQEVEDRRLSPKEFIDKPLAKVDPIDGLEGCPPCIEVMCRDKVGTGKRNEALLAIAIYLKKRYNYSEEAGSDELNNYNVRFMDPLVGINEVVQLWKSVYKKEYFYPCKRSPCRDFCDKKECAKREYGYKCGASDQGLPFTLSSLAKYDTIPPIWFVDMGGFDKRLELSTEALQKQLVFQGICMVTLNTMPPIVKEAVWREAINELMSTVTIIPAPDNSTPEGLCKEYIREFCLSQHRSSSRVEDILLGNVFTDNEGHWLRSKDLLSFLEAQRFKEFKLHNVANILRKMGGVDKSLNIQGNLTTVWRIPLYTEETERAPITYETPM